MITVCIPTIGNHEYIGKAMDSVREAWVDGMELIIVDNSGNCAVPEDILRRHRLSGTILRNDSRLPMGDNWNLCLKTARHKWVHILHDDDWIDPAFYSTAIADISGGELFGIWTCATIEEWENHRKTILIEVGEKTLARKSDICAFIFSGSFLRCSSTIVDRTASLELKGYNDKLKHIIDVDFFARLAIHRGLKCNPNALSHYRIHEGMATGLRVDGKRIHVAAIDTGRLWGDICFIISDKSNPYRSDSGFLKYAKHAAWGHLRYFASRMRLSGLRRLVSNGMFWRLTLRNGSL